MNLSVYIEDVMAAELMARAKTLGKSRNAIIREALKSWLSRQKNWPASVRDFPVVPDFPPLESYRCGLIEPSDEDPLQ